MAKNVWLIVSDLHLYYKNLSSRIDYVGEMRDVRRELIEIASQYKRQGYRVNLLLLGDVFHRSYSNTFISSYDNNFFVMWDRVFGECYSVIGNHELHYYSANPFFTLVKSIDSKKVTGIKSDVWSPQGLLPTIKVVDRLEDGEVVFHFNHYGTRVSEPEEGKINVGLFHQDVYNDKIIQIAEEEAGRIWKSEHPVSLDCTKGYKYCFFGHMHKLYGIFKTEDDGYLYYLASLGRTNSSEVIDTGTERCIPAVVVEDGKLIRVDENKIELPDRDVCLREEVVEDSKEKYELQKLRTEARSYSPLDDDPVEGMRCYFSNDQIALEVIDGLLENPIDELGESIRRRFNSLVR